MSCRDVEERELLDRYVQGTLPDEERDAFEQHMLGCAVCAAGVETLLHLRQALQEKGRRWPVPWWAAAAAGLLLVALVVAWASRPDRSAPADVAQTAPASSATPTPPSSIVDDPLLELAQVAPPAYQETVLRGGGDGFRQAMRLYLGGRYREAIPGLKEAATRDPQASEIWFFLGASHLLIGETEPAIEALKIVTENRNSPFAEEARFYLAKALIRGHRVDEAKGELRALVSGEGAWTEDAKELLSRLP